MSLSERTKALKDIFETLQDVNLEGQILDQEKVQVGLGYSCDVFRARLLRRDKIVQVAVKRIRFFLLDDVSFANNLGREVRLWSRLKHPNVLPLLGYFFEGEKAIPNLVSEWMKHGTAINYIKERPLDGFEVCRMVFGIASGVQYIHTEHNMIHADLKGSNILVSDDGKPLLADFGLSVSSSSTSLAATTYHGQKGSPRWMAKELHITSPNGVIEVPKHTMMTDIWAFGMVISELLTRKVPYEHIANRGVVPAILAGQLPQEPDYRNCPHSLIFRALWAIGLHCWHEDPLKRPSASEVHSELKSFIHDLGHGEGENPTAKFMDSSPHTPTTFVLPGVQEMDVEVDKTQTTSDVSASETHLSPATDVSPHNRSFPVARGSVNKYRARRPLLSKRSRIRSPENATVVLQPLSTSIVLDPLQRQDVSIAQRSLSPIIGLKCFNNWVKSVLYNRFAQPALRESTPTDGVYPDFIPSMGRVLDIGCGKGGDLQKWQKVRAREYVGLDFARNAVDQARRRYFSSVAARRGPHIEAMFVQLDCFTYALSEVLDASVLEPMFDVVSMQYCLHNAFESVQKTTVMLENATKWLRKGGVFIGTMPNDKLLLSHLDGLPEPELSIGNSVYRIRFEDRARRPVFGLRYWLSVHPPVRCIAEYVAHWDSFVQMASEYGLEFLYKSEFHDFYAEHCDHEVYGSLLQRMKVVDAIGRSQMDEDQWEFANFNIAFVFKKL